MAEPASNVFDPVPRQHGAVGSLILLLQARPWPTRATPPGPGRNWISLLGRGSAAYKSVREVGRGTHPIQILTPTSRPNGGSTGSTTMKPFTSDAGMQRFRVTFFSGRQKKCLSSGGCSGPCSFCPARAPRRSCMPGRGHGFLPPGWLPRWECPCSLPSSMPPWCACTSTGARHRSRGCSRERWCLRNRSFW
jgi:hypothetical protein